MRNSVLVSFSTPSIIAKAAAKALEDGLPYSLIRIGDGENSLIQYPKYCSDTRIQSVFRRALGNKLFSEDVILHIRTQFLKALSSADCVGMFDSSHPNILSRVYTEYLDKVNFKNSAQFCTPGIHFYLQQSGHLRALINTADMVTLITGRDVLEPFKTIFPSKCVEQYLIPSEYDFRLEQEVGRGEHYPDAYEKIKDKLQVRTRHLVLVGAGFLGKIYCDWARSKGAVALDIGSVFDYWANIPSREGYKTVINGEICLEKPSFRPAMELDAPPVGEAISSLTDRILVSRLIDESPIGFVKSFSVVNLKAETEWFLRRSLLVDEADLFIESAAFIIWARQFDLKEIYAFGETCFSQQLLLLEKFNNGPKVINVNSAEGSFVGSSLVVLCQKKDLTRNETEEIFKIIEKKPKTVFFYDFRVYSTLKELFNICGYTEVDLKLVTASKFGGHAGFVFDRLPPFKRVDDEVAAKAKVIGAVIGPSHTIRWRFHVRDCVVPAVLSSERFFGMGGAPLWSRTMFEYCASLGGSETFALLVPDFRFGNGIVLNEKFIAGSLLQDGFLGIDPAALTTENDRCMLERGMAALRLWHERFSGRVRYVFWCMFGRQIHDRLAGKFIGDGRYHHPVFNYDEVIAALPEFDIVDLSPLLSRPMHDVRRLFIDTSSHPSQVGYLFLNGLLFDGLDAASAYDRAVATVEADLVAFARKIRDSVGKPVLMTGRSVWLDVLMMTLGATGAAKLAEEGLVLIPIDRNPGQPAATEVLAKYPLASCQPVVVSASGGDLSGLLARVFETSEDFWGSQPLLDWESSTEVTIRSRGETPQFTRVAAQLPKISGAIILDISAHAVEQGPLGMPSWSGIVGLLKALAIILPTLEPKVR